MALTNRNYIDAFISTYLTINTTSSADYFLVNTTAGFPSPPFELAIEYGTSNQELCLCTGSTTTEFAVTRGYDSSTPVSHVASTATLIHPVISAIDFNEMNQHTTNISLDEHSQYLVPGRHNTPTLHEAGITIPTDVPSTLSIGDPTSMGIAGTDIVSTATAAANHVHGRESVAEFSDAISPVGMIQVWPNSKNIPLGWLACDGSMVLISQFTALFNLIGYAFGGTSDFYLLPQGSNTYQTSTVCRPPPNTEFFFGLPNIPAPDNPGQFTMIIKSDGLVSASPYDPPPLLPPLPVPVPSAPIPVPCPAPPTKPRAPKYCLCHIRDFLCNPCSYDNYKGPPGHYNGFYVVNSEFIVLSYTLTYEVYQYVGPTGLLQNLQPLPSTFAQYMAETEYIDPYGLL